MTPMFRLIADGEDVTARINDRLLALTVTDEDGTTADRLEIDLDDRDNRLEMPDFDAELELELGTTALVPMGRYRVVGVTGTGGPDTLTIAAAAVDLKAEVRAPRSQGWIDRDLSQIVDEIAGRAGLTPVVGESLRAVRWPFLAQTAESDLHFLTRIGRDLDATVKAAGGHLIVQRRGEGVNARGERLDPVPVPLTRCRPGWRWSIKPREAVGRVEAEWRDPATGAARTAHAGDGQPVRRLRSGYADAAEAQRACDAALARGQRNTAEIEIEIAGFEPALFAGGIVELGDLRPPLAGEWHLERVTHRLGRGLATSFRALRALEV